jgi:choline dehydrogenase-like flavoprotein
VDGSVIMAQMEVILSAGAVHSPAILQRSGVGVRCPPTPFFLF